MKIDWNTCQINVEPFAQKSMSKRCLFTQTRVSEWDHQFQDLLSTVCQSII